MKQWMRETVAFVLILSIAVTGIACFYPGKTVPAEGYITWAEFDVPVEAMQKAGQADIDSYQEENHVAVSYTHLDVYKRQAGRGKKGEPPALFHGVLFWQAGSVL